MSRYTEEELARMDRAVEEGERRRHRAMMRRHLAALAYLALSGVLIGLLLWNLPQ